MKSVTILLLSLFLIIGMYLAVYSMLYMRKVKEAQNETSIETPKKIFQFLQIGIISSVIIVVISILLLLYELFLS